MTDYEFFGTYRRPVLVREGQFSIVVLFQHDGEIFEQTLEGRNDALDGEIIQHALTDMVQELRAKAVEIGAAGGEK